MRISKVNSVILSPTGIYKIKHIESGKLYVGSAVDLRKRWNRHLLLLNRGKHDNIHLQRSWDKYGSEAFEFSVIEYLSDVNDLIPREQYWFEHLDVLNSGYNLTPVAGSRLGMKLSEETKRKISAGTKGRFVTEETRKRMSVAFTGRVMSPEARAKISIARRNRSKESLEKQAASLRGRKLSPESIAKRQATRALKRLSESSKLNLIFEGISS